MNNMEIFGTDEYEEVQEMYEDMSYGWFWASRREMSVSDRLWEERSK